MVAQGGSVSVSTLYCWPTPNPAPPRDHKYGYTSDCYDTYWALVDTYWALVDTSRAIRAELHLQLRVAGHDAGKRMMRREEIVEHYNSQIHHQLGYSKMKFTELIKFVQDRGLTVVEDLTTKASLRSAKDFDFTKPSRNALVATLVEGDNTRQLTRFFELPSELQVMVCDFHLTDLLSGRKKGLLYPTHPPLSRTCRQLRHDVLSLFYQRGTFMLEFSVKNVHFRPSLIAEDEEPLRPSAQSEEFFSCIPSKHMRDLRSLQIVFMEAEDHYSRHNTSSIEIDIVPSLPLGRALEACSKENGVEGDNTQKLTKEAKWNLVTKAMGDAAGEWFKQARATRKRRSGMR